MVVGSVQVAMGIVMEFRVVRCPISVHHPSSRSRSKCKCSLILRHRRQSLRHPHRRPRLPRRDLHPCLAIQASRVIRTERDRSSRISRTRNPRRYFLRNSRCAHSHLYRLHPHLLLPLSLRKAQDIPQYLYMASSSSSNHRSSTLITYNIPFHPE